MNEYKFSYLTAKSKITIDSNNIIVRIGLGKREFLKHNLKSVYLKKGDFNEIILRYENKHLKLKNLRIMCSDNQLSDATKLLDYLVENTNCKDLRGLNKVEALKSIKTFDTNKLGAIIAMSLMFAFSTLFFTPYIIHYFDKNHKNVDAAQIINNEYVGTSNLTISGMLLNTGMWEKTTSSNRGSHTETIKNFFPLVSENYKNEPIRLILETGDLKQYEIDELLKQTFFDGVLQNVLWEKGFDKERKQFFKKEYGIDIDDDVLVFDTDPTSYGFMMIAYLVSVGILISVFVYLKFKNKSKPSNKKLKTK